MGSSDEKRIPNAEESDIATTVLARDYKGLSNYDSNGVIEPEREGIDLIINRPELREVSNCISARTDRGISNHRQEGTGIVEELWD